MGRFEAAARLEAGGVGQHRKLARLAGPLRPALVHHDDLEERTGARLRLPRRLGPVPDLEVQRTPPPAVAFTTSGK